MPVRRLGTIMSELGHTRLDLLKMDIEGAEFAVVRDMLSSRIEVDQLVVEVHPPQGRVFGPIWRLVRALRRGDSASSGFRTGSVSCHSSMQGASMQRPGERRPRVSFGMIVFNGQPFIRYNLEALYPFAHEIIVVEGASLGAAAHATPMGHSSDGTVELLREFAADHDPERKLSVVTAEDEGSPDGYWRGEKTEQSRAYASRATGDYLWQVDVDEFYQPDDMARVIAMLADDPEITAVSFRETTFWGDLETRVDGWYQRRGASEYHRLFKWGRGYRYVEHRPPTVLDPHGVDLRAGKWVRGSRLAADGIGLYHYSLLFPRQVLEKESYYQASGLRDEAMRWAMECYIGLNQPYRVHNVHAYPSWLERYAGDHPPAIRRLWGDIQRGEVVERIRPNQDAGRLLASRGYAVGRRLLEILDYPDRWRLGVVVLAARARRALRRWIGARLRRLFVGG